MKYVYKTLILLFVFGVSIAFLSGNIKENEISLDTTIVMENARFPILSIKTENEEMNILHGYSGNMAANTIRDSITPLSADKDFYVYIDEKESPVKRLKYEIREVYDNTILESGTVSALEEEDGRKTAKIKFTQNFVKGKEYAVKLTIITKTSKKIHYYTRIKIFDDSHLGEKLDFVMNFHDSIMDKEKAEDIIAYLEPDTSEENKSLAHVTIHSSFDLVSWGDLKPKIVTSPIPAIKEINEETAAIELKYFVTAKTDSGDEIFAVREFYRVRWTADRMYLLNYDRKMETQFDIGNVSLAKSEFKLGITNDNTLNIISNGDNTKMCFVRERILWYYNYAENTAVKVFAFLKNQEDLIREGYDQHNIRILNMDDSGNIDFIVYGYMNRGDYEGRVGILLYKFYAGENRIEEQVYIPMEVPYQILKEDLDSFGYVNENDVFYFTINNTIYAYNIITRNLSELAQNISGDTFVNPEGSSYIAWQSNIKAENSNKVTIFDLESGEQSVLEALDGQCIKVIGSIDSNFIIGCAKIKDVVSTVDGGVVVPMYEIRIVDNKGKMLKSYKKKNIYIVSAVVENNNITLSRVKKDTSLGGLTYTPVSGDNILNNDTTEKQAYTINTRVTDKTLTEYYISLPPGSLFEKQPVYKDTVNTIITEDTTLHFVEKQIDIEKYYVYAIGEILGSYSEAGAAISAADKYMGVVVNNKQQIIWQRGGKSTRSEISGIDNVYVSSGVNSMEACINMVLEYTNTVFESDEINTDKKSMYDILKENMDSVPINLTGSSLDEVLYYVSKRSPVIGMKDSSHAVLIIGYDEFNITVIDPSLGTKKKIGLKDGEKLFKEAGNIFIGYIDQ